MMRINNTNCISCTVNHTRQHTVDVIIILMNHLNEAYILKLGTLSIKTILL